MAKALEELRACPVKIPEGLDDRDAVLHAARFLGGPTGSLQHLWLLAREIHRLDGVTPLSDALGISGCVTSRGWLEIHNPANPHLKLKYFSSSNVGSTSLSSRRFTLADGENSVDKNESFKELMHMEDLRSAVHTLMKAMSLALPWNYLVSALESFLFGLSYCNDRTSHWPNRAKELSDFVDHVLHSNARRWATRQHFLDVTTLRPVFETWVASSRPTQRKKTSLKPTTATGTAGSDVAAAAENTTATTTATGEAGILAQARLQAGTAAADCPRLVIGLVHSRIFAAATTLIPAAPIAIGTAPPAPTAEGQGSSSTSAHSKKAPTNHPNHVTGPTQKLGTSEHVRPSHQQRSCHHPLEG
jgi:hypothetical protein